MAPRPSNSQALTDSHPTAEGWKARLAKKRLLILTLILLSAALILGLALGLVLGRRHKERLPHETPPTPAKWQPAVGTRFQVILLYPLSAADIDDSSADAAIYDIDLFYNNKTTIAQLHNAGRKVLCYFSAGTYEDWRGDRHEFQLSDVGHKLDGWEGERWIDVNSPNVRRIMLARLDLAREKGCDGVDPDNVDAYENHNGLGLDKADAADYVNWLANEAHTRDMSMGLKNAGDIIPFVIRNMQWSVNEECGRYSECAIYVPFIDAGKPVFHIEYPKGAEANNTLSATDAQVQRSCGSTSAERFSTVMKNLNLDSWVQTC